MNTHQQALRARRALPHRIPGLFDFPRAGRRRRSVELARLVESLVAPSHPGTAIPCQPGVN